MTDLYPNNLKNREFDKEDPQNLHSERATIAQRQGASENTNFEVTLTQSKPDSSGCLGILERTYLLRSPEETMELGRTIGSALSFGNILALYGDLGVGKTTFIKGVGLSLGLVDPRTINSPTFNYVHIYESNPSLYHFDLYRLRSEQEFLDSGFVELLTQGITCIEWPEYASIFLPEHTISLSFEHIDTQTRRVVIHTKHALGTL